MKDENRFNEIISNNLIKYRKAKKLTQLQLAKKLNYSDKAISKWERGENLPDVYVLYQIADIYGITINELIDENTVPSKHKKINKNAIIILSTILVWVVATITFVALLMIPVTKAFSWLSFVYAVPTSFIVTLVLSWIWGPRWLKLWSAFGLYFTVPLSVASTLSFKYSSWAMLFIAIPLTIITLVWYYRKKEFNKGPQE